MTCDGREEEVETAMSELHDLMRKYPWKFSRDPQWVITFNLDNGNKIGYPLWDLIEGGFKEGRLVLRWPLGTISITGEEARRFFQEFSEGKAYDIKADGKNILSVTLVEHEETAEMREARKESTTLRANYYSQHFMKKAENGPIRIRERTREEDDD
jgi:hypothetical protein